MQRRKETNLSYFEKGVTDCAGGEGRKKFQILSTRRHRTTWHLLGTTSSLCDSRKKCRERSPK